MTQSSASVTTAHQRKMVVRLRLPPQGKGKGKEEPEDDEGHVGMFDELLDEDDRDTFKTNIATRDKERFEKSRVVADVSCYSRSYPYPGMLVPPDCFDY